MGYTVLTALASYSSIKGLSPLSTIMPENFRGFKQILRQYVGAVFFRRPEKCNNPSVPKHHYSRHSLFRFFWQYIVCIYILGVKYL
jgi:hypothetical protein